MNDPQNLALDIDEQRRWLNDHKAHTGLSWNDIARQMGGKMSTLAAFGAGSYQGNNNTIAEAVYRYRQLLAQRASIEVEAPTVPGYFETPSSRRMTALLSFAQSRGRTIVIATAPGLGKSQALHNYAASVSNVWHFAAAPSTSGVNNMLMEILAAMGEPDAKGTPQALARRIRNRVANTGGMIAIDEAQFLTSNSTEELRSLADATGVALAMLGNEDVLLRLETGSRKAAYARMASRVNQFMISYGPMEGDAAALCDAWGIHGAAERALIDKISKRPGALRTCTQVIEIASMLAAGERQPLAANHLADALALRETRQLAA